MAIEPIDQPKHSCAVVGGQINRYPPSNRTAQTSAETTSGVIVPAIVQSSAAFITTSAVNGVLVKSTNSNQNALKAIVPASSVYVFSANYALMVGQQLLNFRNLGAYSLSPAMVTKLTALAAPMALV